MGENSFNCLDSQKGFNIQDIKDLLDGNKNEDYQLISRFYTELVLLSEVIDNTYDKPKVKRRMGFYVNNKKEIPFKRLTYVKFDGNQIKYIEGNKTFLDKKTDSIDNLFYDRGKEKWLMDIDISEYEELDIDELYFRTKKPKQAKNIRVPFGSYKKLDNFPVLNKPKILEKNEEPIGIKYLYKKINDKELVFYTDSKGFIRSIRSLTDKEKETTAFTQKNKISLIYEKGNKIKKLNSASFEKIALERDFIYYDGKKISTNTLFYHKDLKVSKISDLNKKEDIIFCDKKEIYLFEDIVVFEATTKKNEGKDKAIFIKDEKSKKTKRSQYIIPEIFNSLEEGYNSIEYDVKLMSHKLPLKEKHTILYKGKFEEIEGIIKVDSPCDIYNIYKKYHIKMKKGTIVSILELQEKQDLKNIFLEDNMFLIEEPNKDKKIKCNYLKILFKLRNSIAHGQFKILEKKVIFCNEDKGKTMLRGSILKENIKYFLEELIENTLNIQLLESK